jgi:microcystin-dependent protein
MDICATNWTEADSSNSVPAPDGAPEGMAPSGVNDVLRAHQGAVKRWYNWTVPKVTAGTSTAYTLAYGVAPAALVDGMTHMVQFHTANGAAATLNVNGLGALPIQYYAAGAWWPLPPSLFSANWIVPVTYSASAGVYRVIGFDNRTGAIEDYSGPTAPAGAVFAYGQALSRTQYAALFAIAGTTYGAGDGSTTFNLPDLRGLVTAGKSDMGGIDAGDLPGGGVLGNGLGSTSQAATTNVNGIASGTISGTTDAENLGFVAAAPSGSGAAQYQHTHAFRASAVLGVSASGTSGAFSVVQPTRILNKVLRI